MHGYTLSQLPLYPSSQWFKLIIIDYIGVFFAEALEALLNRIQVDIEVDSNLNSLRKGDLQVKCKLILRNVIGNVRRDP